MIQPSLSHTIELTKVNNHTCSSSLLCFSSSHWQNVGWFQSCTSCSEFRDQEWNCCCQGLLQV